MDAAEVAKKLGLSCSALACTLWKAAGGAHDTAARGNAVSRDGVLLVEQIRDVVRRCPGIAGVDLSRMLVSTSESLAPDLRACAEAAECTVDGGHRWWPTKSVGQLRAGDQIPRHLGRFERLADYEWATIESLTPDEHFGEFIDVTFTGAGWDQDGSAWSGVPHYEMHPVRFWG